MSHRSFLLHCLALFLLQAAGLARQALSKLQHRTSSDSTITALHGLLCAVFLPQLGSISPCTCVSRDGRQLFPTWQLSTGAAEYSKHRGKEAPGSLYHHVQEGVQQDRWDSQGHFSPKNCEGWVCIDTFPALRNFCNLPNQGETNAPHLSISLHLPYPSLCSL